MSIVNLETKEMVKSSGREFTKLVGGFGEGKTLITAKQIGELLGIELRVVNQTIVRNLNNFEEGIDIIDFKNSITQSDSVLQSLVSLGYTKQSASNSKHVFGLSKAGFLLYLKFSEGETSVSLYKDFIEDYFETKAVNKSMKNSIEQELNILTDEKAMLLGKAIMEKDTSLRFKLMDELEILSNRILELEKSMNTEEVKKKIVDKLKPQLQVAEILERASSNLDMNIFAKTLDVKGMGRNNMFKWLRANKYLNKDNVPYQSYENYFIAIPVTSPSGFTSSKTLIKPKGIKFIVDRLIKDDIVIVKSLDQIVSELDLV